MAEVLGIVASVMAVLQITGVLIPLGYEYIGGLGDASKDLEQLLDELQSLDKVLLLLRDYVRDDRNLRSTALQTLNGQNGELSKCALELKRLLLKLRPPTEKGLRGKIRSLKWPLKKKETFEHISKIERYKSLFKFALATDQLNLSKVIEGYVQDTKVLVEKILVESAAEASRRNKKEISKQAEKRRNILNWISPEDFRMKHLEVSGRRQKNTGKWILTDPAFKSWIKRSGCQILWGHGIPGAGKTFLSSSVIDYLLAQAPTANCGVGYIYFDYLERDQQKPINVLASLVKQLAGQRPSLPEEILKLYDQLQAQQRPPTYEELYTILLKASNTFARVFLIFDALDECDQENQRNELLPLLHSLAGHDIRVFLTSRPHPEDIQVSFSSAKKIEISAKEDDLKIYIQQRINENPRAKRLVGLGRCGGKIITELANCSRGMFLLVHFHIEHICRQTTVRQILRELESLKDSSSSEKVLDPTYDRMMDSLHKQPKNCVELALRILSWLVKAKRTLTVGELREAVSVEPGRYELDEWDLPDMVTLLDVCASLVTIDENSTTVRLAHYTVQEYLLRNCVLPDNAEFMLAMACTTYLSFDIFAKNSYRSYRDRHSLEARQKRYPFVKYAAKYMSIHIKACDERLTTAMFLRFLQNPVSVDSYIMMSLGSEYDCYQGQLPLHVACATGHSLAVQGLLNNEADISALDGRGWTALHEASNKGHIEVVLLLLVRGASATVRDKSGQTALHRAAHKGHIMVVRLLLEGGADISVRENYGWTALCRAARKGHKEIVKILLQGGADISVFDYDGSTALHMAASKGHKGVVEILLENGADVSIRDRRGRTALRGAAVGGFKEIVQLLVDKQNYISFLGYGLVTGILGWTAAPQGNRRVVRSYPRTLRSTMPRGSPVLDILERAEAPRNSGTITRHSQTIMAFKTSNEQAPNTCSAARSLAIGTGMKHPRPDESQDMENYRAQKMPRIH